MLFSRTRSISPAAVAEGLREHRLTVVDVGEPSEVRTGRIKGARHIPLGELGYRLGELSGDGTVAFVCRSGARSARATRATRTYAQEAARDGVELRALRARLETTVDMSRALGVSDRPPLERIDWRLEVDADADMDTLEALRVRADDNCAGAWCISNPGIGPASRLRAHPGHP